MAEDGKIAAANLAAEIAAALSKQKEDEEIASASTQREQLKNARIDIDALNEVVYKQHEPVIIWSRNFIDSYRRIVTAIIISGLITLAGFMVQVYYLLQKSR